MANRRFSTGLSTQTGRYKQMFGFLASLVFVVAGVAAIVALVPALRTALRRTAEIRSALEACPESLVVRHSARSVSAARPSAAIVTFRPRVNRVAACGSLRAAA